MKIIEGTVVKAKAGRDDERNFVVTEVCGDGRYVLIADGKTRKLDKPKRKNIKHLAVSNTVIDLNEITDKKLKMILRNTVFSVSESEV
ncbi:MAG: KOW domain-containing RNA-binding protein [Oscillospiraceae bacterium]|nr:KOW domain-containing RNA-binding protein [Oscillospiraceae bacterium]